MKLHNSKIGLQGEMDVSRFLKKKNYKILTQNYKTRYGEIDIIALDKDTIVFVEVKRRLTLAFGRPCEAVDERKQQKIRMSAACYLKEKRLWESSCRFDVIEVLDGEINEIKNAF